MARGTIEELVASLGDTRERNAGLYQDLQRVARKSGFPLEFAVGRRRYRADADGLWVAPDNAFDTCAVESIGPEEYLDALREHLLEQVRELSAASGSLKELIRRFTRRQATWAELKQAAE